MTAVKKRRGRRLLWGMALAGWLLLGPGSAAAGPRVEIPAPSHDFGQVLEDQELTHTFVIRNAGDAPLQITSLDPDCACTAAAYDRRIPPGGQGRITLTIAPYSVIKNKVEKCKQL